MNTSTILKQLTDQSDDICFIYDINTMRFDYVNAAFEAVTKRPHKELYEGPFKLLKIVHKEDLLYVKKCLRQLLKNKSNSLLNFRICRPDHSERWIRMKVSPIVEDNEVIYLSGIGEDDTARKTSIFNMQKIIGWKNANLEILSHDLRGPIGTVQMITSIIDKKSPKNEELHILTKMIADISKQNIDLIQTLLKKEYFTNATQQINKERSNVVQVINHAIEIYLMAQENIQKKITFTYSNDPIYADVDGIRFLQIINNLVSNAIKFTNDKGSIHIHVEKLDASFLVVIKDDGIGIPKRLQPVLFKQYNEAEKADLEGEKSVGLGMWIIRTSTEAHGGKVWFESEINKGTTFYVEIPITKI